MIVVLVEVDVHHTAGLKRQPAKHRWRVLPLACCSTAPPHLDRGGPEAGSALGGPEALLCGTRENSPRPPTTASVAYSAEREAEKMVLMN